MKLAIPSETDDGLKARRSGHFGHTPWFTIVEIDDNRQIVNVESVKNIDHDMYGCGGVIQYAMSLGIDAMLCAGMGRPPLMAFTQGGIAVYYNGDIPFVGDAVQAYMLGLCPRMALEDACNHH